jgi:hypothetical protein
MTDIPWIEWYQSLAKPSWTPAPRTIGLIWQVLYPVIIATFGFVFVQAGRGKIPWLVALPFAINLVANLIFLRSGEQLYALKSDPDQLRNVADDPQFAEVRLELSGRLMKALRESGDPRVAEGPGPVKEGRIARPIALPQR